MRFGNVSSNRSWGRAIKTDPTDKRLHKCGIIAVKSLFSVSLELQSRNLVLGNPEFHGRVLKSQSKGPKNPTKNQKTKNPTYLY